ncbi:MAG: glycosyltransferase family 39 protein [Syntrophobacteraceae bacterium]
MIQGPSRMKIFLILTFFTLLVRLPFFFPDVIDPDESTFILMGQDILDGNLPYEKLWDVKPPLLLLAFAMIISFFGKTIPAVRLGGALCVLLASYFVYLSGEKTRNSRTGFIAALLLIVFSALSPSGGGTTSEIIALVPLTGAALLFLKDELRTGDIFFAGMLISAACMIRLNLAYMAVLAGIFLLWGRVLRSQAGAVRRMAAYIAGGAIPAALCFLPFLLSGKEKLFLVTMYEAPLKYASSQLSLVQAVYTHLARFADPGYLLQNALLLVGFLGGLVYILLTWKRFAETTRARMSIVIFFMLATLLSILKTGEAYGHYLVQALPFVCLVAAIFLDYLLGARKKVIVAGALILSLMSPASAILAAYKPVALRAMAGERLTYGPTYELADFLKEVNPENGPVYFMNGHIVHWFQNTKPLSRLVTHPNNIGKEYLVKAASGPSATVESELSELLAKDPAFIVKSPTVGYLKAHPAATAVLSEKLFMDYELITIIDEFMVYRHTGSTVQISNGRQ